jgi:small basic protein (TIGR04137 family)
MSVDRSLKLKGALERHRNILTRAERIEKLKEEERWKEGDSLFGLPKVAHRKSHAGKKTAEEKAADAAAKAEGAVVEGAVEPVAGAAAPAGKAGAKAPAAAAGAKVPAGKAAVGAKSPAAKAAAPADKKKK